jgi:hypothetical protein
MSSEVSNQQQSVLEAAGDHREGTGILCTDASGLCVASEGSIDVGASGVYTNMVRLASKLQGYSREAEPIITIETDESTTLIKSYDGHTVALKVPTATASSHVTSSGENAAGSESGSDNMNNTPSNSEIDASAAK